MRPALAVGNGDRWLMSTPNGKRGFFHVEWKEGGEQWQRISATATECPWINALFLADEQKSMTDTLFRQEHMCECAEAEGRVFTQEMHVFWRESGGRHLWGYEPKDGAIRRQPA